MNQPGATRWGEDRTGLDKVLTCRCWDCAAYRRHLLRKAALVAVLIGLSCGWAFDRGAWDGKLATRIDPVAELQTMAWL